MLKFHGMVMVMDSKVKQPLLVPYRCPECNKLLCYSLEKAECYCPKCKLWFRAQTSRSKNIVGTGKELSA